MDNCKVVLCVHQHDNLPQVKYTSSILSPVPHALTFVYPKL